MASVGYLNPNDFDPVLRKLVEETNRITNKARLRNNNINNGYVLAPSSDITSSGTTSIRTYFCEQGYSIRCIGS